MGKLFGTDGIRGVVGENLTADMAFRVGQAVGTVLMEEKGGRPTVVIGKDTRISSDMLEAALTAGILSVGGDVLSVGTIPTPAVAFLARQEGAVSIHRSISRSLWIRLTLTAIPTPLVPAVWLSAIRKIFSSTASTRRPSCPESGNSCPILKRRYWGII